MEYKIINIKMSFLSQVVLGRNRADRQPKFKTIIDEIIDVKQMGIGDCAMLMMW